MKYGDGKWSQSYKPQYRDYIIERIDIDEYLPKIYMWTYIFRSGKNLAVPTIYYTGEDGRIYVWRASTHVLMWHRVGPLLLYPSPTLHVFISSMGTFWTTSTLV